MSASVPSAGFASGAAKRRSKFDLSLSFAAEQDGIAAVYHKYFRNESKCKVLKSRFLEVLAASSGGTASVPPSPSSSSGAAPLTERDTPSTPSSASAAAQGS